MAYTTFITKVNREEQEGERRKEREKFRQKEKKTDASNIDYFCFSTDTCDNQRKKSTSKPDVCKTNQINTNKNFSFPSTMNIHIITHRFHVFTSVTPV